MNKWRTVVAVAGGLGTVIGAYFALGQVGLRPVVNSDTDAMAREFDTKIMVVANDSKLALRIALQNDRRYWTQVMATAQARSSQKPGDRKARQDAITARQQIDRINSKLRGLQ